MQDRNKAPEAVLNDVHRLLAEHFSQRLKEGTITPSELSSAVKFLKDNGINCDGPSNPVMQGILDDLPEFDETTDMKSVFRN